MAERLAVLAEHAMFSVSLRGVFAARRGLSGILRGQQYGLRASQCSCSSLPAGHGDTAAFDLKEMSGNAWQILSLPNDVSLAHCVSSDFDMSRGIAKDFKRKYESVELLKSQGKKVGEVAVLERDERSYVYYLITREHWWDAASSESLHSALLDMRSHCEENSVGEIAMPRLGSGYDQLDWTQVRQIIASAFAASNITCTAFSGR